MEFSVKGTIIAGESVNYHDHDGDIYVEAVVYVWERNDNHPPLVNLSNDKTSVPHLSAVAGATGNYWTSRSL